MLMRIISHSQRHTTPFYIHNALQIFKSEQTWTCLQSCPRAGSWMRRKVMGHFSDTLMAVCSTPSSPFRGVLPAEAATLLKFRLTEERKCFRGKELLCELLQVSFSASSKARHKEKQVGDYVIKMCLCIITTQRQNERYPW